MAAKYAQSGGQGKDFLNPFARRIAAGGKSKSSRGKSNVG
jgi:hypothetical protein